jgi:cob(I)alamin adenosyltransferase
MSSTQTPQRGTGRGIGIRTAAGSDERAHGQLHVYDGDGKGKSQAALGVVLRTIGLGICEQKRTRVLLLRFLKGPGRAYDEDAAIEALQQGFPHLIDQVRTGRGDFFSAEEATRFDRQEAQRGWDIAKGAIASDLYSVVVLDELNPVLDLGLLDVEDEPPASWCNWPTCTQKCAPTRAPAAWKASRFTPVKARGNPPAPWARGCRRSAVASARTKATEY